MKIKELIESYLELRQKTVELYAQFPEDDTCKKDIERYDSVIELLRKHVTYKPKKEFFGESKLSIHKCKCGACYIDACFEGYCGQCGQKLKWEND